MTSAPGAGSTFWYTARLAKVKTDATTAMPLLAGDAESTLARDYRDRRILLVEDEPLNREVTLHLLQSVFANVSIAEDGARAVALAAANAYNLILMDVRMPTMDGLQATRTIRMLPGGARVPIVAFSADAFADDRARCLAAGMNDFVGKPINPDAMFATLLRWL